MVMVQSEYVEESIEALKIICYELVQAKSGSPATVQLLKDSANELVKELTQRMKRVSDFNRETESDFVISSLSLRLWKPWREIKNLHQSVHVNIP